MVLLHQPDTPHSNGHTRKRFGTFTGGGNAPGLNAVIAGVVTSLAQMGHDVVGIKRGWKGMIEEHPTVELSQFPYEQLQSLIRKEGTILGSSRTKIDEKQYETVRRIMEVYGLDGLIAIGGDDTLGQARRLHEQMGIKVNGVPKTIDCDIRIEGANQPHKTFGFETAYHIATQHIEDMMSDAQAMGRIAFVECMGRKSGLLTLHAAKAAGAHITLIPEFPIPMDVLLARIDETYKKHDHAVVAVAEGYGEGDASDVDAFGHARQGGVAKALADTVKKQLGYGTQSEVIGYKQRNGKPLANDALYGYRLGARAGYLAGQGTFGRMAAMQDGIMGDVSLSSVSGGQGVTLEDYDPERMTMRDVPWHVNGMILGSRDSVRAVTDLTPQ